MNYCALATSSICKGENHNVKRNSLVHQISTEKNI